MSVYLDCSFVVIGITEGKQAFLHAVNLDIRQTVKPKKLTYKQDISQKAAVLRAKWEHRNQIAADKMLPELERLINSKEK